MIKDKSNVSSLLLARLVHISEHKLL